MPKIVCCAPGMMGDAIYSLPTIKYLAVSHQTKIDFWTSPYCAPLKKLFEYQSYIKSFNVLDSYKLIGNGPGFQPWFMEVPQDEYDQVFQMGFRSNPYCNLRDFISISVGAPPGLPIMYEFPTRKSPFSNDGKPKVIVAPRGETTYKGLFLEVIESKDFDAIQVGADQDAISERGDFTGLDFLPTLGLMVYADAFLGLMSSNLVLANGFPDMIKIAPHDGKSWDMRHVIYSDTNKYPIDPIYDQVKEMIHG